MGEAPPCTPVLLTVCRRRSPPLLPPPSRSRQLLHQRGSTPSGSEDPSLLPSPPSCRCGSPSRSMTSLAQPSSTGSVSKHVVVSQLLLAAIVTFYHFDHSEGDPHPEYTAQPYHYIITNIVPYYITVSPITREQKGNICKI